MNSKCQCHASEKREKSLTHKNHFCCKLAAGSELFLALHYGYAKSQPVGNDVFPFSVKKYHRSQSNLEGQCSCLQPLIFQHTQLISLDALCQTFGGSLELNSMGKGERRISLFGSS